MLAAAVDVVGIGGILLVPDRAEHLHLHDLGKADDGVQGRAQFVADIGEEVGLGAVGDLRLVLGLAQILLGADARGGIGDEGDEMRDMPAILQDRVDMHVVPERLAVLALAAQQQVGGAALDQGALQSLGLVRWRAASLQEAQRLADHLLRLVAGDAPEGRVDVKDRRLRRGGIAQGDADGDG